MPVLRKFTWARELMSEEEDFPFVIEINCEHWGERWGIHYWRFEWQLRNEK